MSLSEANLDLIRAARADPLLDQDWAMLERLLTMARAAGCIPDEPPQAPEDPRLAVVKHFSTYHAFYNDSGRRRRFYSRLADDAVYLYETHGKKDHRLVGRVEATDDSYYRFSAYAPGRRPLHVRTLEDALHALAKSL